MLLPWLQCLFNSPLIEAWNVWPQTLHVREPIPVFFSRVHVTEFSWLQKRQENVVLSFC